MHKYMFTVSLAMILGISWIPDAGAQQKVAFVTSVTGNGDLGNVAQWPDNDGLAGLAAADRVCQNKATDAGLSSPSDFVAWLSDSTDDAYCRVHDLGGKKTANCGQGTLPAWAGPWVRTDGYVFAESIDLAIEPEGRVYMPVALDELGFEVDIWTGYFTATDTVGGPDLGQNACADWSSSAAGSWVTFGNPRGTTSRWSSLGGGSCSDTRPLLCLEAGGAGPALPYFARDGAQVFVTSASGSGNLVSWPEAGTAVGLAAGDTICRTLAENAGLHAPESYVAWLSDDFEDAIDRLTGDGPWVRLDGITVAASQADLVDDLTILSSIHLTESGDYVLDQVFTGTYYWGQGTGVDCGDWTVGSSGTGTKGRSTWSHLSWTDDGTSPCADENRLYCFSNSNSWAIFDDGFESGDITAWSSTSG